jgi:hypothetical protein
MAAPMIAKTTRARHVVTSPPEAVAAPIIPTGATVEAGFTPAPITGTSRARRIVA